MKDLPLRTRFFNIISNDYLGQRFAELYSNRVFEMTNGLENLLSSSGLNCVVSAILTTIENEQKLREGKKVTILKVDRETVNEVCSQLYESVFRHEFVKDDILDLEALAFSASEAFTIDELAAATYPVFREMIEDWAANEYLTHWH